MLESVNPCSLNDGDLYMGWVSEQNDSEVSSFWNVINSLNSLHNMTNYDIMLYNMCNIKLAKKNNEKFKCIKKTKKKIWHRKK
jgi:hypothetical protein